ncbi:MAG: 50S ribosomal protein L11 methyltransferase [Pseudomonadota bacterium]
MSEPVFFTNPYEQLTIYYIEGILDREALSPMENGFIGNWEEDGFSFLFFSEPADDRVKALVAGHIGLRLMDTFHMSCEEWHGDRIESYTTGSLCISPPWKIPFVNSPHIRHILLDPGVVFGTGRHQTTEDCLGFLERICAERPVPRVLDIGTGTGLLALGAAALGCGRVLALDFNLLAVRTTLNNVRINGFEEIILPIQARGEDFMDVPADLVMANVHYDVMKNLIETRGFLEKSWFILSGLLKSEAKIIISRLEHKPVTLVETVCNDGVWTTILGQGKGVAC